MPYPVERIPVFLRSGARITFSEPMAHTGEAEKKRKFQILFNSSFRGLKKSKLGKFVDLS